jgi:hypothetical protein
MPEMTSTHRTRKRATGAAVVLGFALPSILGLAASAPAFGTDMENLNDASYWSELYGADCEKYDPPGTVNDQGYLADDDKAVVLYEGDWVVLIVKSGSEDVGHGAGNAVYENPVAGTNYYGPLNNGGEQGTVSHWIVCGTPAPLVASASVSETPATCDVGERLVYGTFVNATPSGTADGTTGPASYEVIATRTTTATFLPAAGVSEDGTTQTFTGTLSGPLDPNDYPDCRGDVPPDDLTYSDGEPYWECTPGVLRPAEISFVRSHFVATASWNSATSAYEYGEPEFDYDEVITIPTPENFSATCPPTVIDEPSSSAVDACGTKDDKFTPYPAGEHYTVLNADGRNQDGVGTATSTATADVGYTFGTLEAPVATLENSQEFTDGSCGLALTGQKPIDDVVTIALGLVVAGLMLFLDVKFGWFSAFIGWIRRRVMGFATPTA